jgi:hypothetical protein
MPWRDWLRDLARRDLGRARWIARYRRRALARLPLFS